MRVGSAVGSAVVYKQLLAFLCMLQEEEAIFVVSFCLLRTNLKQNLLAGWLAPITQPFFFFFFFLFLSFAKQQDLILYRFTVFYPFAFAS